MYSATHLRVVKVDDPHGLFRCELQWLTTQNNSQMPDTVPHQGSTATPLQLLCVKQAVWFKESKSLPPGNGRTLCVPEPADASLEVDVIETAVPPDADAPPAHPWFYYGADGTGSPTTFHAVALRCAQGPLPEHLRVTAIDLEGTFRRMKQNTEGQPLDKYATGAAKLPPGHAFAGKYLWAYFRQPARMRFSTETVRFSVDGGDWAPDSPELRSTITDYWHAHRDVPLRVKYAKTTEQMDRWPVQLVFTVSDATPVQLEDTTPRFTTKVHAATMVVVQVKDDYDGALCPGKAKCGEKTKRNLGGAGGGGGGGGGSGSGVVRGAKKQKVEAGTGPCAGVSSAVSITALASTQPLWPSQVRAMIPHALPGALAELVAELSSLGQAAAAQLQNMALPPADTADGTAPPTPATPPPTKSEAVTPQAPSPAKGLLARSPSCPAPFNLGIAACPPSAPALTYAASIPVADDGGDFLKVFLAEPYQPFLEDSDDTVASIAAVCEAFGGASV
jgi:hypothetical protein